MSDPIAPSVLAAFAEATGILDASEARVRDMIENGLMDVAGINRTRVVDAINAGNDVARRVTELRTHHLKKAFRLLREKLPKDVKIYGQDISALARGLVVQDASRIKTAISVGLTAGEDNTDIAHRVIGSARTNGANGMTEITRQHLYALGRMLLSERKSRMSGASADDPTK